MAFFIEPSLGLTWFSDTDPTASPGVPAPLWVFLVRTDVPSLYYKAGDADTAWVQIGVGGGGPVDSGAQVFQFVCDGTEDPAGFPIDIPVARSDTNYDAFVMLGDTTDDYTLKAPPDQYATTHFVCVAGSPPANGDILLVAILTKTS